jgi:hypothetical protein
MKVREGAEKEVDSELIANVQLYHDDMSFQDSLLQWYRALFMMFEAGVFALVYFLITRSILGWIAWATVVIGMIGCFLWWIVCMQRSNLLKSRRRN